jgi:hypothetical protein
VTLRKVRHGAGSATNVRSRTRQISATPRSLDRVGNCVHGAVRDELYLSLLRLAQQVVGGSPGECHNTEGGVFVGITHKRCSVGDE